MLDVQRWAELRREHFVCGVGIKELARRYGVDRNTVRRAIRSDELLRYQRPAAASNHRGRRARSRRQSINASLCREPSPGRRGCTVEIRPSRL